MEEATHSLLLQIAVIVRYGENILLVEWQAGRAISAESHLKGPVLQYLENVRGCDQRQFWLSLLGTPYNDFR